MKKKEKRSIKKVNRSVHIATLVGVILFMVPASVNQSYIPIVLILMGINIFNSSLVAFNGKKIPLFILLAFLPIIIYLGILFLK